MSEYPLLIQKDEEGDLRKVLVFQSKPITQIIMTSSDGRVHTIAMPDEVEISDDATMNLVPFCEVLAERFEQLEAVIKSLLDVLPDSDHSDEDYWGLESGDDWDWCWNELCGLSQRSVKDARKEAVAILSKESIDNSGSGKLE